MAPIHVCGHAASVHGEVLNEHGEAIGGLYAAGSCLSDPFQDGPSYNSGLSIGEATFFGRWPVITLPKARFLVFSAI